MAEHQALGAGGLGSDPTSATPWLWDIRHLCALVSPLMKYR